MNHLKDNYVWCERNPYCLEHLESIVCFLFLLGISDGLIVGIVLGVTLPVVLGIALCLAIVTVIILIKSKNNRNNTVSPRGDLSVTVSN